MREVSHPEPAVAGGVDDIAAAVAQRDWMVAAIGRLPRRQREVVVLRFLLDLSVEQTATALGMTQGTVKSHTARALNQLRELLTERPGRSDHLDREVRNVD